MNWTAMVFPCYVYAYHRGLPNWALIYFKMVLSVRGYYDTGTARPILPKEETEVPERLLD